MRIARTHFSLKAACTAALIAGFSQSAFAQDGTFAGLLSDGKGEITTEQAEQATKTQFQNLDANHDGVITENEFVDYRLKMFKSADSNDDGVVTRSEARSLVINKIHSHSATQSH